MAGLRERKKEERKTRIQNAAVELFGTSGFNSTTMEKIAGKAGLGVGTLYNYYASKGDILLSIISDRAGSYNPDFEHAIGSHTDDLLSSINSFFDIYFRSFSTYNRVIWREFISNALSGQTSLIDYISRIDAVFIENLAKLLACFKKEGKIKEGADVEKATLTLYSLIIFHILKFISDESMTMECLRKSLGAQASVVIEGLV